MLTKGTNFPVRRYVRTPLLPDDPQSKEPVDSALQCAVSVAFSYGFFQRTPRDRIGVAFVSVGRKVLKKLARVGCLVAKFLQGPRGLAERRH